MSEKHEIDCWSCHATTSLAVRGEFDGCCWGCGVELDLETYLINAMDERDAHRAALSAVTAERDAARRECDENEGAMQVWRRRTVQAEAERDQLRAEVEQCAVIAAQNASDAGELYAKLKALRPIHAMILNALDRDAEEGKTARGEMAAELRAAMAAKE